MSTEVQTKKWFQSKVVRMALALMIGAGAFFLVSYNLIDPNDLANADNISPELQRGIDLIKGGQWLSGLTSIASALIAYFRIFQTRTLIPQSLSEDI